MANFPTTLDDLGNPQSTDFLYNPSHSAQHASANDILELLEAKAGVNNSTVITSLDYFVRTLQGMDPKMNKLLGWSIEPAHATTSTTSVNGVLHLVKLFVPRSITITNLLANVQTAGVTLTASQNFGGLYNSAGTLLSSTADQSGVWNSTGLKTMALTTPQVLVGGADTYVWATILTNGTTAPQFSSAPNVTAAILNAGLAAADGWRFGRSGSAQTVNPASFTPGSSTSSGESWWVGVN